MEKEYKVKNDVIFKEIFSRKGCEEFLIEFLSSLLELEIKKIEIEKEVDLEKGNVEDKLGVIDIKATLNDKTIVDIEMQRQNNYNIIERTTKYASDITSSQLKIRDDYSKLKEVIVVTILDYNFLPYKEYIHETVTVLKKHRDYEINKYHKYYYIELPKFRKEELEIGNKVSEWLTFIDYEDKRRVEEVVKNNKLIKKANEEYEYLTGDAAKRRWAELKLRGRLDMNSARVAGIKDGERKASINIAKSMLKKGFNIDMILDLTNLSEEEVQSLIK